MHNLFFNRHLFLHALPEDEAYDEHGEHEDDASDFVAIARGEFCHLGGGGEVRLGVDEIAQESQNGVPYACTEGGEEEELTEVHAGQSGRNADELSHGGHKAAEEGGGRTVVTEIGFGVFNLGAVDQAHMADAAVGKTIDDGAAEPTGQIVVDECTEVGTEGGYDDHHEDVHRIILHQGEEGCRGHHDFRRERDEGTFNGHEYEDPPVVEVLEDKINEWLHGNGGVRMNDCADRTSRPDGFSLFWGQS